MGNSFTCLSPAVLRKESQHDNDHRRSPWIPSNSRRSKKQPPSSSPQKEEVLDDAYIKQQAEIASMLYQHHLQNNSDLLLRLDRSMSAKAPNSQSTKKVQKKFSKRSQTVSSSNPFSLQLSEQNFTKSNLDGTTQENKHFVLVHGGGFGAWCWYKIIALLKESECKVDSIDLTGSGSNFCDINSITTIAQYAKPLTDFLANLDDNKQVILVGHDIGGACLSYAMDLYPLKVSKAIFVAATMLTNGQSALDVFSQPSCLSEVNRRAQKFVYAKGDAHQPTSVDFDKSMLEDLLFNRSPTKDIALASVSMRTVPFAPVAEKISLSSSSYGSIPRFYVKTDEDLAIPLQAQEAMIESDPPKQVFELKGSDHSPFFSKPQALHRILMEISDSDIPQQSQK